MTSDSYTGEWEDMPEYIQEVKVGGKKGHSRGLRRVSRRKAALGSSLSPGWRTVEAAARRNSFQSPQFVFGSIASLSRVAATYLFEIIGFAFLLLRKPLSIILVSYMLTSFTLYIYSNLGSSLGSALQPMCGLPLLSGTAACKPVHSVETVSRQADYPQLMRIQVATFEELLDGSIASTRLALEIRKAEISANDLATHMNVSGFPRNEDLVDTLIEFSTDSRQAGRALQLLTAKILGAVDRIIAWSDYALRKMEKESMSAAALFPWSDILFLASSTPEQPLSTSLISHFNRGLAALEAEVAALIEIAEASLPAVYQLEDKLKIVHAIIVQEEVDITMERGELLTKLWTRLGGNREALRRCSLHLRLVAQITEYRKMALAHVVRPIETLHRLSAELQALRIRLGEPLRWEEIPIPFDIQLQGIRAGVQRLILERERAKVKEDAQYASLYAKISN